MASANESDVAGMVSDGVLVNKKGILSMTCHEVERSWRGMVAEMRLLAGARESCLWSVGDPGGDPDGDDPFMLSAYGRLLTDYRGIRRLVFTRTGRLAAHSFYDNASLTNPCISFTLSSRISGTESMYLQQMLLRPPVLRRHEAHPYPEPTEALAKYGDESDRCVVAAKAGKELVESGRIDCLIGDPSPEVRSLFAGNCFLGAGQARRLAEDPDWHVRRSLCERRMNARKIFMDDALCRMLGTDPEFEVRVAFAAFMLTAFRHRAGYGRLSWMLDDGPDDELKASLAMMMVAA